MLGKSTASLIYIMGHCDVAQSRTKGFTLVELMIALAISGFLLLGVVGTYSSIQDTIATSKELENSQEVIRYSAHVFSRSLKQTKVAATPTSTLLAPDGTPIFNVLTVTLPPLSTSCKGEPLNDGGTEIFIFDNLRNTLTCNVNDTGRVDLLTGIDSMQFIENPFGTMVTVQVYPTDLSDHNNFPEPINIDIALTSVILAAAL
jgi:prepilin-type N-terminal cleavage/methylation domain-containing protein